MHEHKFTYLLTLHYTTTTDTSSDDDDDDDDDDDNNNVTVLVVTLGNQPHIECFLRRLYSTSLYIIAFIVQVLSLVKSEPTLMLGQTDRQHQQHRPQTQQPNI